VHPGFKEGFSGIEGVRRQTLVLHALRGVGLVLALGLFSLPTGTFKSKPNSSKHIIIIIISISSYLIYPIRGGRYRGIYDIDLKGLLWDIGLLLNAPYKIDSMMEMSLMMICFVYSYSDKFFLF
jgi:hypothetical protein